MLILNYEHRSGSLRNKYDVEIKNLNLGDFEKRGCHLIDLKTVLS